MQLLFPVYFLHISPALMKELADFSCQQTQSLSLHFAERPTVNRRVACTQPCAMQPVETSDNKQQPIVQVERRVLCAPSLLKLTGCITSLTG